MSKRTVNLCVRGMHCEGCETVVEQAVKKLAGVHSVRADYGKGLLTVTFDARDVSLKRVAKVVFDEGYSCTPSPPRPSRLGTFLRICCIALALVAIAWLLLKGEDLARNLPVPDIARNASYGALFVVGLLTGFHCVGMCGGFVIAYTAQSSATSAKRRPRLPHFQYGLGKLISYTLLGGVFGLIGSVVAFTPAMQGYAATAAGLFLILFGVNMLDWFPALHRIGIKMPRWLGLFIGRESRKHRHPFAIGLLNGLMIACGPLQAMYVMATGTGDFAEGARLLLFFGLGTLPIMLGFGLLASAVSGRVTHGLVKVSAVLVVALGLTMLNRGLVISGSGIDFRSLAVLAQLRLGELTAQRSNSSETQTIRMTVTSAGYSPNTFVLRLGVPVKWVIDGQEVTECNRRLVVPALGLSVDIRPGENLVEFTPATVGIIPWSCWMGMLQGRFVVEGSNPIPNVAE